MIHIFLLFQLTSLIILLGMLSYYFLKFLIKVEEYHLEEEKKDKNKDKDKTKDKEDNMLDELKYMIDRLNIASPAEKFYFILMLGGSTFSQICVSIINFPVFLYERNKKNKKTSE